MSTIKVQPIRSSWSQPTFTHKRHGTDQQEPSFYYNTDEIAYLALFLGSMFILVLTFVLKRKT